MDNDLPEINSTRKRIEITEAELAHTPTQQPPRSPSMPPPSDPHAWPPPPAMPPISTPHSHRDAHSEVSETTRLMCAAAYLDGVFAQDVVDEVIHEEHRAVAIPPGVDIGAVAKHCVQACRQKLVRDVLLTSDLLLAVVLFVVERSLGWLLLGFLLAWAIVLWDIWSATYFVVVKRLNARSFSSEGPPPLPDANVARRIEELEQSQRGNLTVYSGFLPFSGAGHLAGGWSFVVDLRKPKRDVLGQVSALQNLTPVELYEGVRRAVGSLEMPNMELRDRLFVSGSDIREDSSLLPNQLRRPLWQVDERLVNHYIASPTHRVRHYQCIQIVDWRGELVVSLFLRFGIKNERLFCELSKFVLFPLKEELHRYDNFGGKIQLRHVVSMVSRSFFASFGLWLRSPKIIVKPLKSTRDRAYATRQVEQDPYFDYGAPETALDRVRSRNFRRYFQLLDREMYVKLLEKTALDTIVEILDQHNISTADLVESAATIISNSVIMPGGTIKAENIAMGGSSIINRGVEKVRNATGVASEGARSPAAAAPPS
jgi:hypothetical protein